MAADNEYSIKIVLPEEDNQSAMAGANNASTGGTGGGNNDGIGDVVSAVGKKAAKMVSFSSVKSTADQLATYAISTVSLRSGAAEYEQRMSTVYSIGSQVVGAAGTLVTAGAVGGPAGLAVAAMSIAANGISKLIGIAQKQNTLNLQESVENVSIGMQNVRAGTAGRRGGNQ